MLAMLAYGLGYMMLHMGDQSLNNLWGSAAQLFHAEMRHFFNG